MFFTDMTKREPAYRRIEQYLLDRLASGDGRTVRLPGEIELAESFGVSRMTARQAYNSLVAAGLVTRQRSKGTFARVHLSEDLGAMTTVDFLDRWHGQGYQIDLKVLRFETRPAPQSVAEAFGVAVDTPLTYVERLRSADGEPVALDTRWLPAALAALEPARLETRSVFGVLEEYGFRLGRMDFELSVRKATGSEGRVLSCRTGESLFVRRLWCATVDEQTVLVGQSVHPSDRVSYRGRLSFGEDSTQHGGLTWE